MEVSRDGQICAIFGKGDLFGANPKSEKAERSSANVRALRKMLKLTKLTQINYLFGSEILAPSVNPPAGCYLNRLDKIDGPTGNMEENGLRESFKIIPMYE